MTERTGGQSTLPLLLLLATASGVLPFVVPATRPLQGASVFSSRPAEGYRLATAGSSSRCTHRRLCPTAATATGFGIGEFLNNLLGLNPAPSQKTQPKPMPKPVEPVRIRKDAVLVLGATGKTGKALVEVLLESGRDVVAAVRSKDKAKTAFNTSMGNPHLWVEDGIDVTRPETLQKGRLFTNVTQVVSAMGPVFGDPKMSSEAVDYKGTVYAIEGTKESVGEAGETAAQADALLSFEQGALVKPGSWSRLDDVIMGGRSSSGMEQRGEEGGFGRWSGDVVVEGGGFCGTVVGDVQDLNAAGYDGLRLRVRGDGNRYKFRVKTAAWEGPELTYQAPFDTVAGQWITVDLPFERFVCVRRNDVKYDSPAVNKGPSKRIGSLGVILSRFEFNEYPNPKFTPGKFQLDIKSVGTYRAARPSFVLISSAATERYHRLTAEQRAADIPIVQLNPQGVLNYKYQAETKLRLSGLRYAVVRATGLMPESSSEKSKRLQVGQGDVMSGRLLRRELAEAVVAALDSPHVAGTSFEIRRDENEDAKGKPVDYSTLFNDLVPDKERSVRGLLPFPAVQEPPPPVTEERTQEILNDPRVQEQQARAKEAAEAAAAKQG